MFMGKKIYEPPRRQERQGREGSGFLELVGDTTDTVFDEWDVEVDEESKGFPGEFQVGGELCLMDGKELFDCLQLRRRRK